MINVFVTNLGKYNEGELVGEWLELPCSSEDIEDTFANIGINEEYEEYFITDWECDLDNLEISEFSNIHELNELAEQLESCHNLDVVDALMECYGYTLDEAIYKADDVLYEELDGSFCNQEVNLAYAVIDSCGSLTDAVTDISRYFDYEQFGRELRWDLDNWDIAEDETELEHLKSLSDIELAEWYIDGFGEVSDLDQSTLEMYFDYEAFGSDLMYDYAISSKGIAIWAY